MRLKNINRLLNTSGVIRDLKRSRSTLGIFAAWVCGFINAGVSFPVC